MIVVPNIGSSASGSLSGEGWLGFGLSIVALLSAVMMMVLLQASRNVFSVARTQCEWHLYSRGCGHAAADWRLGQAGLLTGSCRHARSAQSD